jgi:hypothetical protein
MRTCHGAAASSILLLASVLPWGCGRADAVETPARWTTPREIPAHGAFSANDHRVAALRAGPGGTLHALFLDDADGDGVPDRLLHAWARAGTWQPPVRLDAADGPTAAPALVVDAASGAVRAFWIETAPGAEPSRGGDVVYRTFRDGAWLPARVLHAAAPGAVAGRPVLAGDGLHVVYGRGDGRVDHAALGPAGWRTTDAGREGAEPMVATGPGGRMALVDLGTAMSPLLGGTRAHHDPWLRVLGPSGWTAPARVHVNPRGASHAPQVAWGADGTLHAVWLEADPGELLPTHLLYASSRNGVAWSAPRELAADAPGHVFYTPRLAVDGRGAMHLTFARFRESVADPRHFHLVLRGGRWSPVREILPGAGPVDSELETTVDADGVVHAIWNGRGRTYLHATLSPADSLRRR